MHEENTFWPRALSTTWVRSAIFVTLVIGILFSVAAFILAWRDETAHIRTVLEFRAEWRTKDMEGKLDNLVTFLAGTAAFVATTPNLSQDSFQYFIGVRKSYTQLPDHTAIYWEFVPDALRQNYEQRMRQEIGDSNFAITEGVPETNDLTPAQKRAFYFPTTYRATLTKNSVFPIGYDIWSDPTRRALLQSAWREGRIVSSAPLSLQNGPPDDLIVNLVSPIYRGGRLPDSEDKRSQALTGLIGFTYLMSDLLSYFIADTPPITEDIYLFKKPPDFSQFEDSIAKFDRHQDAFSVKAERIRLKNMTGMVFQKTINDRDSPWFLVFNFGAEEVRSLRTFEPHLFLLMGLFVTLLVTCYAEIMRRKRAQMNQALSAGETQLRVMATALVATNVRMAALVASSPAAIICLDIDGNITLWNPAAEEMLGFTAEEMMGKPYSITPHEELKPLQNKQKNNLAKEATQIDKAGRKIHVTFTSAPFYDENSRPIGSIYVMSDISERLSLERQLRQAQKMEAVGQLTGGIAHDFNNILGIVIGNLDLMEGKTTGMAEELRQSSIEAVIKAAALTRALLAFSRQQSLSPTIVNINRHLATAVEMLSRLLGEQIDIKLNTASELWTTYIDPVQLESAVTNLAINARDAMPKSGQLIICTYNRTLDEDYARHNPEVIPGDYACIEVSDTGRGMPPEVQSRVFEPFFSTKAPGKGTGLGLSMVYGFIRQSGGHIKIYSELGHGTTIRLYLPRYTDVDVDDEPDVAPKPPPPHGGGETIFVVEDNIAMRITAIQQLESLGYKIIEAANGEEALRMIQSGLKFDLLFSDVIMTGNLSGFDLAKLACELDPNVRVLLTSGFPGLLTTEHLQVETGSGIELLSKPYRKNDLAVRVRETLDQKPRAAVSSVHKP
jgi:PAS domain S-box-containing protein